VTPGTRSCADRRHRGAPDFIRPETWSESVKVHSGLAPAQGDPGLPCGRT
jgi:hypothetical protein